MSWQSVLYFLLWAGAFAVMMRFGRGAPLLGHRRAHGGTSGEGGSDGMGALEKAVDPALGMAIQTAEAKSAAYRGNVHYSCSQNCREKFEAALAVFTTPGSPTAQPQEHHHGSCC